MLRIAGPTAGRIGLKFFVDTHGWPGVLYAKKNRNFEQFFKNFSLNFFPWVTPGPSASIRIK